MNRFPAFTKTLRDQRVPATAWGVALLILGFVHVAMFPQYKDAASALSQTSYYQSLAGEAGGVGTPGGYLNAEYFTGAPVMVLIFAIIAGTGVIAADETGGTLDLVLAQPIRRSRLLVEKSLALVVLVTAVSLASVPGLYLGKLVVGFDLSLLRMTEACLAIAPIALFYLALAVLGSAAIPSRTWATILAIGGAIGGFFLNTFGTFVSALDQVRKLSPFYWTNYGRVIAHGTDWARDGLYVVVASCLFAVAAYVFVKRDVSGSRTWALPWFAGAPFSLRGERAKSEPLESAVTSRWPVARKTLRDQRTALLAWASVVLVLSFVHVVIYPQFHDAFKAFDEGGAFQPLAGEAGSISSPAGYLALEFFSYVPLLILIAVVIAGTGVFAGDESGGTLDLVLAQPVSRRRLVVEKSAALVVGLVAIVVAAIPGLVVAKVLADFDISVTRLVAAALFMVPLSLLYLSMAVFCSAAFPSRNVAGIVVIGAAIAGYFLNTLGAFVDALEQVRKVSPFYWADYSGVLIHGFDWATTLVFVALSVGFFVGGVLTFERRDLSSGAPSLRLIGHRE